jgi:hypothetical protein
MQIIKNMSRVALSALAAVVVVAGCQQKSADEINDKNLVTAGDPSTSRMIGDSANQFHVVGSSTLNGSKNISAPNSKAASEFLQALSKKSPIPELSVKTPEPLTPHENSLTLGFPLGLLGEQQVFGAVITQVSDVKNENLGNLKLTDLTPLHVTTGLAKLGEGKYALALVGCLSKCTEGSEQTPFLALPIAGVDAEKGLLYVDLASLGDDLNLVKMLDPDGKVTKLKTKSSKTTTFDYSLSTLVFDVETHMVPITDSDADKSVPETVFTVRWYLRLASAFNPAFLPRPAAKGVGFFMTERATASVIERHSVPSSDGTIKYYIKDVPEAQRAAFASCFDEWNDKFVSLTGKKIFDYEFVEPSATKYKLLVPGDVRYNIVAWDLVNKASYGGLGPSVANQYSGEMLSSNVLVQGPTIMVIYAKWFNASQRANELRLAGNPDEAEALLSSTLKWINSTIADQTSPELSLSLGQGIQFRVASQTPSLEDPLVARDDFDPVPTGITFENYMFGYFHDMLTHELGHNLGLRHNFRGSLGATDTGKPGSVSASVMEYLGRGYRNLDRVGSYDLMAINYGYKGVTPKVTDLYCTDEDQATEKNPTLSAECSQSDATKDPFSFFEQRLDRAVNLLVASESSNAPSWTVPDMAPVLKVTLNGLGFYASSAARFGSGWTNFFTENRPTSPSGVKDYVIKEIKKQICNPKLEEIADSKSSEEAKAKTLTNISDLREKTATLLSKIKVASASDLACD